MFTVKTYIDKSTINGMGVMAAEPIAKGTIIWKFQEHIDSVITNEQFETLPPLAKEFVLHYGYYREVEGGFILCGDNSKFTNHADNPNTEMDELHTIALRDIRTGEEITEDYYNFDEQAKEKLTKKD